MKHDSHIQLFIAALLTIAGIALLFVGVIIAPKGEIHESLLVAFGEIATFAGSIIGIDYRYKTKNQKSQITNKNDISSHPPKNKGQGGARITDG